MREIQQNADTDIYLCGGGEFAGWLLENGMFDQLKLKLNPIILGTGVKLFGASKAKQNWKLLNKLQFEDGLLILTYKKG